MPTIKQATSFASPLSGKQVALPESRQLDLLADMFEKRGARVKRVPLVNILDSSDTESVQGWLRSFIDAPPDYLVILTGEGIRRLAGFADRLECLDEFTTALAQTIKLCRGPKPGRALKELGLKPDLQAREPTTAGIIQSLGELNLRQKRVSVQLYGEDPNQPVQDYLATRHCQVQLVAPYRYAPASVSAEVTRLIAGLAAGEIDVIAFTSQPQVERLFQVAGNDDLLEQLQHGLQQTIVAAVGPVVKDKLLSLAVAVDVSPDESFFMKPMLRAIEKCLARRQQIS